MVLTNIIGGLGNQMFQYAVGKAVSLQLGTPLRLDISGFANYELHQGFELQRIFDNSIEIADESDVRSILGWQSFSQVRRLVSKPFMRVIKCKNYFVEPHFQYWDGIKKAPKNVYLSGYWQSERYFLGAESQIRSDFSFRLPLEGQNIELAKKINEVNAISLHVRRGDYASNPKTTAAHGLCSLDYYQTAINYISERVEQPKFFIFSDDIEWVKENLKVGFPCEYVNHNQGEESYNDMRLMSLCQHHIIANSSFSWWGAWLNPSPDKIVVAPKQWFPNNSDVQDLFPIGWATL